MEAQRLALDRIVQEFASRLLHKFLVGVVVVSLCFNHSGRVDTVLFVEGIAIELVDTVSKNAPAGSEQAIALVKSAIGNATAGYEQLSKTAKQAAETLQSNVSNSVEQFSQNATKAAGRAKK